MIFTPKHVLGIHGYTGNIKKNYFWKSMKHRLAQDNISMIIPQFSESRITQFKEWEDILNHHNLSNIDTIIGHSLGTRVATEYIIKNNIHLNRLVLVSPSITAKRTDNTQRPELIDFFNDYKFGELDNRFQKLKNLVTEIIVIASIEDSAVPFSESKQFAEMIGAKFIQVEGCGHFNDKKYEILEKLVINGI